MEALALSRQLGDPETLTRAGLSPITPGPPEHWDERLHLAEEAVGWPREGVMSAGLSVLLWFSAKALLAHGELARAEEIWRQVQGLARQTHLTTVNLQVSRSDDLLAIVEGRLEESLALRAFRRLRAADRVGVRTALASTRAPITVDRPGEVLHAWVRRP